jgi:hypothetical protein
MNVEISDLTDEDKSVLRMLRKHGAAIVTPRKLVKSMTERRLIKTAGRGLYQLAGRGYDLALELERRRIAEMDAGSHEH